MTETADTEICWMTALELGQRIAAGELSSERIVNAHLARIERLNPILEAYVTVVTDAAIAQARERDRELTAGRSRGPLHGVPYALKDIFATSGIRTTAGSSILADWVPDEDATIVSMLTEAGAVLLGKVNTHEFAFGVTTQNQHGRTKNPWDLARIAGGSSGGSGAALAAGLCPFSLGSDTAGSIRLPAAFTGTAGLKPTYGRTSLYGVVAQSLSADHVGPMARSVADLAAVLQVIAGHDPRDPESSPEPVGDYFGDLDKGIGGLRIGVPRELFGIGLEPGVADAFAEAQRLFARVGARVSEVSVPLLAEASAINNAIVPPETAAQHLDWAVEWFAGRTINYGEDVEALLATGRAVPATELIGASRRRKRLRAQIEDVLRTEVDLLLSPTVAVAATAPLDTTVTLNGRDMDLLNVLIHFLCGFSITGIPALALPAGFDQRGLPVSIQLIGRAFDEATVLRAGHAFERATTWSTAHPAMATAPADET